MGMPGPSAEETVKPSQVEVEGSTREVDPVKDAREQLISDVREVVEFMKSNSLVAPARLLGNMAASLAVYDAVAVDNDVADATEEN